jgi:hypothetical protein
VISGYFHPPTTQLCPIPDSERTSCEALDAVEVASFDSRIRRTDCNFVSLSKIPTVGNGVEDVQDIYVEDCSCVVPLVAGCCLFLL